MQNNIYVELIERARSDPQFFHRLVFDTDAALSEFQGLKKREEKRFRALSPEDVLGVLTGRSLGDISGSIEACTKNTCLGSTCGTTCTSESCDSTCDGSCHGTCSGDTCKITCDTSCYGGNATCSGESCSSTCARESCNETCSGESCNYTCGTDTCGNTCSGESCDMTRPFIVDVGEPAFESIKHMLKGSGLAPYVSFLPRTRDIDPPELIPAPAPKFPD